MKDYLVLKEDKLMGYMLHLTLLTLSLGKVNLSIDYPNNPKCKERLVRVVNLLFYYYCNLNPLIHKAKLANWLNCYFRHVKIEDQWVIQANMLTDYNYNLD